MEKSDKDVIVTGVVMDGNTTITFTEIRQRFDIREELLLEMVEHGLVEPVEPTFTEVHLTELHRIESAMHLYHDLGVNIAGAVLALDLLEQLNEVQTELTILQKQLNQR
jgi:chaperone modulatory protein CbpM